jgi:hypothetical protein
VRCNVELTEERSWWGDDHPPHACRRGLWVHG